MGFVRIFLVMAGMLVAGACSEADFGVGCVTNAFGAEFCGQDAVSYCEEYGGPGCADIGQPAKGRLERETDAEMEKLDREAAQAQQEAEADQAKLDKQLEEDEREADAEAAKLDRQLEEDEREAEADQRKADRELRKLEKDAERAERELNRDMERYGY